MLITVASGTPLNPPDSIQNYLYFPGFITGKTDSARGESSKPRWTAPKSRTTKEVAAVNTRLPDEHTPSPFSRQTQNLDS